MPIRRVAQHTVSPRNRPLGHAKVTPVGPYDAWCRDTSRSYFLFDGLGGISCGATFGVATLGFGVAACAAFGGNIGALNARGVERIRNG
jgi:hypothetical protein